MSEEKRILKPNKSEAQEFFSTRWYKVILRDFYFSITTFTTLMESIADVRNKLLDVVDCFPENQRAYVRETAVKEYRKINNPEDVFKDFEKDFVELLYEDVKVFRKYLSEDELYSLIVRELNLGGSEAIESIVAQICEKTSAEYVESFKTRLEEELETCEDPNCRFYVECTKFGPCLKKRIFDCNGKCGKECNCPLVEKCCPEKNIYPCKELQMTTTCNGIYPSKK